MASFTTPLDTRYIDGRRWEILAPFEYHLDHLGSTERVLIPVGFITDFASIPQILWNVLPPCGKYGKAAVVHDWLYQRRTITVLKLPDALVPWDVRLVERGEADHILLEAMQALRVDWWTRSTVYAGVRAGGWHSWHEHREHDHDQ